MCYIIYFFILDGLAEKALASLSVKIKKGRGKGQDPAKEELLLETASIKVFLYFKRYIYDPQKKMIQNWNNIIMCKPQN